MSSDGTAPTRIQDDDPNRTLTTDANSQDPSSYSIPIIPDVTLDQEIGRGGMGVVYRGHQTYLDRQVAVKLLLVDKTSADDEYVKRFQREAKILAGLAHPHIVSCYSAGLTAQRQPYLIMEFIDGPNLKDWVAKHGPLEEKQAVRIIRDLALALNHAHEHKIIHRDVKPENVLLAKLTANVAQNITQNVAQNVAGDQLFPFHAKLVDLGLARPSTTNSNLNLTVSGRVMGTPTTMAPEQFDDPDGVDFRADMYGLGCILFYALTGKPAFSGQTISQLLLEKMSETVPNPSSINPLIGKPICDLVAALLAKQRINRPVHYQDLIARCDLLVKSEERQKKAGSFSIMALVAGVIALVVGGFLVSTQGTKPEAQSLPVPSTAPITEPIKAQTIETKQQPLGEPQSLWLQDVSTRLQAWTIGQNGQWSLSDANEHGIAGARGIIQRPLSGDRWEIKATFTLGNMKEAQTEWARFGVFLPDGSQVFLKQVNLSPILLTSVERLFALPGTPPEVFNTSQVPVAETTVSLTLEGQFLRIHINGIPIKEPIGLPAVPTQVFFEAQGQGPLEVSTCSIRLPGKEVLK
jgi:serine/threonine protein kinase